MREISKSLMTVPEIAKQYRLSEVHVRRHLRAGRLQGELLGTVWLCPREAVRSFFEARGRTPYADAA